MKKSIFIFAVFSLLLSFSSCNDAKKEEKSEENQETVATQKTEEADQINQEEEHSKQKIELLDPNEFATRIIEMRLSNIVDVRTPQEFAQANIPKSININVEGDNFEEELGKLPRTRAVFIYCKSGVRSQKAVEKAKEMGFERIVELKGGIEAWKTANMELAHSI